MSNINRHHIIDPALPWDFESVASRLYNCSLLRQVIKPQTLKLYSKAAAEFINWYKTTPGAYSSPNHFDVYLSTYLNSLFESGLTHLTHANNMVFGLMHIVPTLRQQLPIARRCLKGWKKSRATQSWPPMSWELACMLAVQLSSVGWMDEGVAVLIAYDGYFRISELLQCRIKDFLVWNLSNPPQYQLRLRDTKTGPNMLVTLTNPHLGNALLSYIQTRFDLRGPDNRRISRQRIFQINIRDYRRRFRTGCELLGWESVGFVPHSLRHGHASDDFIAGVPVETIQFRGRWSLTESTKTYIQNARVHLIRGRLNPILPSLPNYNVNTVLELMQQAYLNSLPQ